MYRLYNSAGELLYIGISKDPLHRWAQGHRHTSWWREVASFTWDWYPTRQAARKVEQAALAADAALCNIHSTPRHGENQRAQRAAMA
ncbi:GIY-YIG nuclease family protein [Streptomyces sp. OE57]|uniref:GIY-YIG nuclease family protein n=1 Tax=Streptomyces lacaronensis TaxID=3379885 RepID=UPI0039B78E8E